jgi:hypothetical protein
MARLLRLLSTLLVRSVRSRHHLLSENLALRQQVLVLARHRPRPRFSNAGRFFWVDRDLYPLQGPGGELVPEAVKAVISSGITLHDYKGFTSTLRLRYFGLLPYRVTDFSLRASISNGGIP